MNTRQQKYKKFRLEGYSAFAAAIKAGYSKNTAINARKNIENRLNFDLILESEGLTDNALAKHAMEGFLADKVVSVESDETTDSGRTRFVNVTVPDWVARHKYFESILKLRNKIKTETPGVQQPGETKVIIIRESNGSPHQSRDVSGSVSVVRV